MRSIGRLCRGRDEGKPSVVPHGKVMEVEAQARFMRIAPRKARLVADTVVGMPVKEALVVLQFTQRAAAIEVAKVLKSAAANASNNFSQDEDALVVKRIQVNP